MFGSRKRHGFFNRNKKNIIEFEAMENEQDVIIESEESDEMSLSSAEASEITDPEAEPLVEDSVPNASGEGQEEASASDLNSTIASLLQQKEKERERLLRLAADYENFKKRSKRDTASSVKRAEERIVLDFLPIIDNLERALCHASADSSSLLDGVRMVHKQFLSTLERYNIQPFDSLGMMFSPERHEAVQQIHSEAPLNTVCQELQRGYLRGDSLIRPAMVVVSQGPAEKPAAPASTADSLEPVPLDGATEPGEAADAAPLSNSSQASDTKKTDGESLNEP
jgi:molecular chaperone GrpE